MRMKRFLIISLCMSVVLLIYLSTRPKVVTNTNATFLQTRDLLTSAQATWHPHAMKTYILEGEQHGFWDGTQFKVVVTHNTIISLTCSNPEFLCDEQPSSYRVSDLFATIASRITTLSQRENIAASLYLEFDQTYGYPVRILANDPRVLHDELDMHITRMTILD